MWIVQPFSSPCLSYLGRLGDPKLARPAQQKLPVHPPRVLPGEDLQPWQNSNALSSLSDLSSYYFWSSHSVQKLEVVIVGYGPKECVVEEK